MKDAGARQSMATYTVALLCGIKPGTKCEVICRVEKVSAGDGGRKPGPRMTKLHPAAAQLYGYNMSLQPASMSHLAWISSLTKSQNCDRFNVLSDLPMGLL